MKLVGTLVTVLCLFLVAGALFEGMTQRDGEGARINDVPSMRMSLIAALLTLATAGWWVSQPIKTVVRLLVFLSCVGWFFVLLSLLSAWQATDPIAITYKYATVVAGALAFGLTLLAYQLLRRQIREAG